MKKVTMFWGAGKIVELVPDEMLSKFMELVRPADEIEQFELVDIKPFITKFAGEHLFIRPETIQVMIIENISEVVSPGKNIVFPAGGINN